MTRVLFLIIAHLRTALFICTWGTTWITSVCCLTWALSFESAWLHTVVCCSTTLYRPSWGSVSWDGFMSDFCGGSIGYNNINNIIHRKSDTTRTVENFHQPNNLYIAIFSGIYIYMFANAVKVEFYWRLSLPMRASRWQNWWKFQAITTHANTCSTQLHLYAPNTLVWAHKFCLPMGPCRGSQFCSTADVRWCTSRIQSTYIYITDGIVYVCSIIPQYVQCIIMYMYICRIHLCALCMYFDTTIASTLNFLVMMLKNFPMNCMHHWIAGEPPLK